MTYGKRFGGYPYCRINTKQDDTPVRTTWVTPERIRPQYVKSKLCELGPAQCASCGLCAFGRFYVANILPNEKAAVTA